MADENQKAYFVISPEMRPPCDFGKKPAEKKGINGDEDQRMSKVPVILEIELAVDQAEDKIGVRKESCGDPGNGSPRLDLFVLEGLPYDRSRNGMG